MRTTRGSWSWALAVILLAPWLLGSTYKWVDPQGQVHFTDSPPPAGIAYQIIAVPRAPSGPAAGPAGSAPSTAATESVPATATASPRAAVAKAADAVRDEAACVAALYQLEVLAGDWKVYKPGPGEDRTYLHDRDRPAEIERLARERDANCSEDADVRAMQTQRGHELFRALGPDCREAREKLQNLKRDTARSAPSDIEKQQDYVAAHCPETRLDGVWLADWLYVRPR